MFVDLFGLGDVVECSEKKGSLGAMVAGPGKRGHRESEICKKKVIKIRGRTGCSFDTYPKTKGVIPSFSQLLAG